MLDYCYITLAQGHARVSTKRPVWRMRREVLDPECKGDTVRGRRGLISRYDQWADTETEDRDGHKVEGVSFADRVRRGWFLGLELFKESLLDRVEMEEKRGSRNYWSLETMRDHHQRQAMRSLNEAKEFFWRTVPELRKTTRGVLTRAAVGWAIWKETVVTQRWIAEKFNLKSAANASQQILRFSREPDRNLPERICE